MIRPPQRSTLFPYTTLFRSHVRREWLAHRGILRAPAAFGRELHIDGKPLSLRRGVPAAGAAAGGSVLERAGGGLDVAADLAWGRCGRGSRDRGMRLCVKFESTALLTLSASGLSAHLTIGTPAADSALTTSAGFRRVASYSTSTASSVGASFSF